TPDPRLSTSSPPRRVWNTSPQRAFKPITPTAPAARWRRRLPPAWPWDARYLLPWPRPRNICRAHLLRARVAHSAWAPVRPSTFIDTVNPVIKDPSILCDGLVELFLVGLVAPWFFETRT